MSAKPLIIVLHGPSGVGKDSVIDALRAKTGIHRATSSTSRAPRPGERDGVDYHFYSRERFEDMIAAKQFAESAKVYDDWKGLEWQEIEGPLSRGEDVIIRTDVQGARTWRERLEGAVFIFLGAEDRDVLRARLVERGTEDPESLARRMAEIEEELADEANNDYVVINRHGRLEEAVEEIVEIIESERRKTERPAAAVRT
ncbi:MAG: guanylate kinase [Tepidiformaceae bacterium]